MTMHPIPRPTLKTAAIGVASLAVLGGALASTDYGPATWYAMCNANWNTSGYGKRFYVVHDMEGYWASSISLYQRCSWTSGSVHYWANGKKDTSSDGNPGALAQMVRDSYYAWHARCWNGYSMGTEHEGFASNPAWFTTEMYNSGGDLIKSKCEKFGIAKDRNHVIAHGQKSIASWRTWMANQGYSTSFINCNTHTDPGPYWNWTYFMQRINGSGTPPPPTTINPPYAFNSDAQGWTAGNSMSGMAWIGPSDWNGSIYNDQQGNDAWNYGPPCSFTGGADASVSVSVYPQNGNTANHDMQVFWKTDQANAFSADKSSPIVTYSAQNKWVALNLDINANHPGYYQKTVNQFRLDFDQNNSATRWIVNHFIVQTTPRFWFSGGTDGWNAANGLATTWWTDCCGWPGILVADQTGNDAFVTKDISGLNYRGGQNDRVYVRLYPQGGSGVNHNIQLFWATSAEDFYSEAKSVGPIYYTGKDAWVDIWFNVGANGGWAPQNSASLPIIRSLRLDFDQNNTGVRWIVDQIQVVHNTSASLAPYNNASIVGTSIPATVNAGQPFTATVTMKNCGSKTWDPADATYHKLGSQSPVGNTVWGLEHVKPAVTAPGANATFTINATAPASVGTHSFDWQMAEVNVERFGPIVQATINVISPGPAAPGGVTATAPAWNQVNVTWTDNSANETGFKVLRSTDNVNFSQIASVGANVTSYSNTGLNANTTYYYRVLSTNSGGDSAPSNTASVTTPRQPPGLTAISDMSADEGQLIAFTVTATDPNGGSSTTTTWQNFESFPHANPNESVLFKRPANSASTSGFIDTAATNYTQVFSNGPTAWGTTKALKAGWNFKTGIIGEMWLRLNTYNTATNPNPAIALDQQVQFKYYGMHTMKVAIGVRETGTTAAYGANGGTSGAIEWVGVTNTVGGVPIPDQQVALGSPATLSWNIPFCKQWSFSGDGVVPQNNVKGVLEHIVLQGPSTTGLDGVAGANYAWLDDFQVVECNKLAYTLDAGAPSGAAIGYRTGKFAWTPASGQAGTHNITVRVTDKMGLQDYKTFKVTVVSIGNHPPVLAAIGNKTVNELTPLTFTATATDVDAGQTKTFSLDAGAPAGASINATSGAFTWTPTESQGPGSYPITVRVTDNGSPASNDWETITVTVNEVNVAPVLAAIADQTLNEGQTLNVTASATDADLPANTLTYSLVAGAPVGMTINASSGAITWTTTEVHGPDAYPVTVRVTDAGGLSAATTFNVIVNEVNTAPVLTVNTTQTSTQTITDFEDFLDTSYNGTILFRQPSFSATTSAFLDPAVTNFTKVTMDYPGGDSIQKAFHASWSFKTGQTNPWLRLATYNASVLPNPTIKLDQRVRFSIYADKAVQVALGVRETGTGADVGQNGGISGTIEFVGVSGMNGSCPIPTRTVAAGSWQTLEFNLPAEGKAAFTGDGVLTGLKGVLEHLVLVPAGGAGVYNIYLDALKVITVTTNLTVDTGTTLTLASITATDADFPAQTLTFSLDAGAPAGAIINPETGLLTWTPTAAQGPSTNVLTIRVTDNGPGNLNDAKNITVVVRKVNVAPVLNLVETVKELNAGGAVTFTAEATDADGDVLTFSLQNAPSGAAINASTGEFSWTPPNVLSTNTVTIRVTDNGVPPLYDERDMVIIVVPTNTAPVLSLGTARITEPVFTFETFTNGTPNEQVMFKKPANSATTSMYVDTAATNYTTVTTSFPAGNANAGAKVLRATWTFKTGVTDYWVRLTTANTTLLPNPTINAGARLKFDVYSDKALKVGVGIRETGTTAENGANGGTTGTIEYVGCSSKVGTTPVPTRTVNANTWTTLEFNLPAEPVQTMTGDGILSGGQQVIEHLILKGEGGTGACNVYVDNFQVVTTPALPGAVAMKANSTMTFTATAVDPDPGSGLTFGLDADAPAGAVIDMNTGAFVWTPAATGNYSFTVFAEDNPLNGAIPKSDAETLSVTVAADGLAPKSSEASFVAGGDTVTLTWDSQAGTVYQIQSRTAGGEWTNVRTVAATGTVSSVVIANEGEDALFRIVEADDAVVNE